MYLIPAMDIWIFESCSPSEMLANELLSSGHGQVSLQAVHRFLSHNPEWLGQTIGAGLAPETEEQGTGIGAQVLLQFIH